jgi:hypothetical protein
MRLKPGKLYSYYSQTPVIAAGGSYQQNFNLRYNNNQFYLRRLTWASQIYTSVTNVPLNWYQQSDMVFTLNMGVAGVPIGLFFENFSNPADVTDNGARFVLYEPKEYNFEYFYVPNVLPFVYTATNAGAGDDYYVRYSIIAEIDNMYEHEK